MRTSNRRIEERTSIMKTRDIESPAARSSLRFSRSRRMPTVTGSVPKRHLWISVKKMGQPPGIRFLTGFLMASLIGVPAAAQSAPPRPAVIDMHVHSTNTSPEAVTSLNLRYVFLSALQPDLDVWAKTYAGGYMP